MSDPGSKHGAGWRRALTSRALRLGLLLFSLALFGVALWRSGPREILAQLLRIGFGRALLVLIPYALGTALGALPWATLLPRSERPRLSGVLAGRFVASSANALLPLFGLAGEPTRLLWLETEARAGGLAAMVVDRALYNSANAFILLAGVVTAFAATDLPRALCLLAGLGGLVMLGVTLLGLFFVIRVKAGSRMQRLLRRALGAAFATRSFGEAMDSRLLALVRGNKTVFVAGAVTHLVARSLILCEVYVGLRLLREPFALPEAVVLAVVPIGLSLIFSAIPSEIGVHEGGLALMASALGHAPALGVALVLLQRFRQLVYAAFAPLLLRTVPARPAEAKPSVTPARGSPPRPSPCQRTW